MRFTPLLLDLGAVTSQSGVWDAIHQRLAASK